jgi:hypothetical protein
LTAQTLSSGSIEGTVADESGGVIPGVTVTVSSPALQVGQISRVTDAQGFYRIPDLPAGQYEVRFELVGFRTVVRSGLTLTTAFNMRVDARLELGALEEVITVTSEAPLVDLTSTRGGRTVSTEELVTVLPGNKTVADLVNMTPGLRNTAGENPGTLGQNARPRMEFYGMNSGNTNMTMMIDGFSIIANNPVPDVGATAEVDVKTFGNTADIKEVGAAINMVLKSGGNEFHGSFSAATLQQYGENITQDLRDRNLAVGSELEYFADSGGDIGGYLVRDRLWFFAAGRWRRSKIGQPGLVENAGPDGRFLTGDEPAAFQPQRALNLTGKVTALLTQNYSANVVHSRDQNKSEAELQGQEYALTPRPSTGVMDWKPRTTKVEFKGTPTSQSLFSVQFGKSGYDIDRTFQPDCVGPSLIDLETGLAYGCRFAQYGTSNFNFWVADTSVSFLPASQFLGARHEFKFGHHWSKRNNRPVAGISPKGEYQLYVDRVGGVSFTPVEIEMRNHPVKPEDWDVINSLYFQDQFRVGRSLTFNLGVRYERQHSYVEAQCREAGAFDWVRAECFDEIEVGSWSGLAPRAAMAWDVTGSGRSVVKFGYGYFIPELSIAGNYNPVDGYENTYRWSDPNRNLDYDPGEVDFVRDIISDGSPGLAQVNPDLKLGYVHETTLTFEQQVTSSAAFRLLYLYRTEGNQSANSNIARPFEVYTVAVPFTDPGPDGRAGTADDGGAVTVYDYPAAFRGSQFDQTLRINRPGGRTDWNQSFEVSFSKRMANRWSLFSSYTATQVVNHLAGVVTNPNAERFELSDLWIWKAKVNGNLLLPYDISLGAIIDVVSGSTGTRTARFRVPNSGNVTIRMEDPGSQREDMQPSFNLRASRRFDLGGARYINISLDALNVLNSSAVKSATYVSGPTFGTVTDIMPPRQFRVGVAYSF